MSDFQESRQRMGKDRNSSVLKAPGKMQGKEIERLYPGALETVKTGISLALTVMSSFSLVVDG